MINRRSYLLGISATTALLSGCSELSSETGDPNSRISEVLLINARQEPVTVKLKITQDDKVVHEKEHRVESATGNTGEEVIISEDWMDTPATYKIEAKRDSITSQYNSEEQTEIHSKADNNSCFRIAIMSTDSLPLAQTWSVDEECSGNNE